MQGVNVTLRIQYETDGSELPAEDLALDLRITSVLEPGKVLGGQKFDACDLLYPSPLEEVGHLPVVRLPTRCPLAEDTRVFALQLPSLMVPSPFTREVGPYNCHFDGQGNA